MEGECSVLSARGLVMDIAISFRTLETLVSPDPKGLRDLECEWLVILLTKEAQAQHKDLWDRFCSLLKKGLQDLQPPQQK